jgi:hypothetical protein
LRLLLGLIGAIAVVASGVIGATELRLASRHGPAWPAAATAAFCAIVVWGGVHLLAGAARGHIVVRRNRGMRS